MEAGVIEFRANFVEALLGDRDTDVYGGGWGSRRFVAIRVSVELGSHPAKNVKLDTGKVSRLGCSVFIDVRAFLNEEVSAFPASLFPAFIEPRSAPSPVIELIKVGKLWVIAAEL
jgi:hypothetical protein